MANKNRYKEKKNKKQKKDKKMFGLFGQKAKEAPKSKEKKRTGRVYKNGVWVAQNETIPTTGADNTILNVVLFKQSTLDEIARICLPEANGSEFQVHYRCLQLIFSSPTTGNRLSVTIPTVFFNMPQKVSTASVDFNLNEVSEISKMVAPISEELANEFAGAFPTQFFIDGGFEVEARESESGSIHRHPGNFGFSSTDLDNKVSEPGVIFRNLKATDRIQIDSVMYIPNQTVQLVTTETRMVNIEPVEDGIEGSYKTAPTISFIWKDKVAKVIDFGEFFRQEKEEEEIERKFATDHFQINKEYPEMKDIFNYFLDNLPEEYEPELVIDPKLITSVYGGYYRGKTYTTVTNKKSYNYYDEAYLDEYLDYDETDFGYPGVDANGNTFEKDTDNDEPLEVRPTWRKLQVVNALKSRGIKTEDNAMITGDASESDIIAIVTETKLVGWTDPQIRIFFKQHGYPDAAMDIYYNDLTD
jgi:hypothetical protein